MTEIGYEGAGSGGWLLAFSEGLAVAVERQASSAAIETLWGLVKDGANVEQVLDDLIRGGVSAASPFVIIGRQGPNQFKVLVRGTTVVRFSDPSGEQDVSAQEISTWTERQVEAAYGFECVLGDSKRGGEELLLLAGVVRAAAFWSLPRRSQSSTVNEQSEGSSFRSAKANVSETEAEAVPEPVDAPVEIAPEPTRHTAEKPMEVEETRVPSVTILAPPTDDETPTAYDYLFGETVFHGVQEAAVKVSDHESEPLDAKYQSTPLADSEEPGDHDGETVLVSDLAAMRAKRRASKRSRVANEPSASRLYVDLSTGGREYLDQTILIGRSPSASRVPGGKVPRLVSMNTANQDISRTHAQVSSDGGTVVVTDLHSRNGTLVTLPGKSAQKLRQGEPTAVIVGTVIDLGDGATLTVGEEP
jgi:FHA domain